MKNIKKSYVFSFLVVFSFVWWIISVLAGGFNNFQFSVFYDKCDDLFADTLNNLGYSHDMDPYRNPVYGGSEKPYPPLVYCLMFLLSRICLITNWDYLSILSQPQFLIVYVILIMIGVVLLYELLKSKVLGEGIIKYLLPTALVFSFPFLYTIERGNTLVLTLIAVVVFLFYYDDKNKFIKEIALFSLAIAAAFKLTPAFFGLILIYDKKWKEALRCMLYGVVMIFVPFCFLKGGIIENILIFKENVSLNGSKYAFEQGCGLSSTAYKYYLMLGGTQPHLPNELFVCTTVLTAIICSVFVICGFATKHKWIKIMGLSLITIILPFHSGTYNLVYIIPAVIVFFNEADDSLTNWLLTLSLIPVFWVHMDVVSVLFGYNFGLSLVSALFLVICLRDYYSKKSIFNRRLAFSKGRHS